MSMEDIRHDAPGLWGCGAVVVPEYIGKITGTNPGARDLKQTPRANCVVSYSKRETKVASLDGKVHANSLSICMG